MKRLPYIILAFLIFSMSADAQTSKFKKILIFPFKVTSKEISENFGNDMAGVLGAELARDGDIEIISGKPFASLVEDKKPDIPRISRVAERMDAFAAVWGTIGKLDDGVTLELNVLQKGQTKPRFFSVTGKDIEDLLSRIKDVGVQISNVALDRLKVGEIKIEGNKRIQKDAILNKLGMKTGSSFRKSALSNEIRELYNMGYFEDVQIKAEESPKGEIDLTITLKERPSIKSIEVEGNKVFSKDNILDALTTKSFAVASVQKIRDDIEKLKKMYEKEGYYQPNITYELKEASPSEAILVFKIDEGTKSYLTELALDGRKSLSEKQLKKIMNIKEKGWLWWIDDSGTFTREKLEENRLRLMLFYLDNGFINVQVGAPEMDITDGSVKVKYPISEGDRFQVRKLNIEGDLVGSADEMLNQLTTKPKTWFSRTSMTDDIKAITKIYNNLGYAYADIEPKQKVNDEYDFIDLTYKVNKGERVSIERVDIAGNERTRDKVIRRALAFSEGDLYNADRFDATKSALEGMDYFEAVRLKTSPGARPDLMNVTVEVVEKKTGSLSAGLGYSSQEGAMGNVNLRERNLLGLGIVANAKMNFSGRRNSYEGSLTYPWLFDYPISTTGRGYKSQSRESQYLRDSDGFSLYFSYPLYGLWSMTSGIARDSSKLSGIEQGFARSIINYYKQFNTNPQRFMNVSENSMSMSFNRDTRNNAVIPTAGSKISLGSRFSGFGGDVAYSNYFSETIYYKLLFWKAIFKMKANTTLLQEFRDDPIPFDRRVLLGGIQSIRGYKYGEIGPRDRYGNVMGGDRAAYSNMEIFFPIVEALKLNGVLFFDAGNAWNVSDSPFPKDIKAGYGLGIRWVSPMGPLRLEYGWKVNPDRGEEPGAFAFGMGQLF